MHDTQAKTRQQHRITERHLAHRSRGVTAVPRINAMKRSASIEGLRMALARVKTYWAEMDATTVAAQGSAIGRVAAEHYFEEVLEGARSIETQCSKNVMFK